MAVFIFPGDPWAAWRGRSVISAVMFDISFDIAGRPWAVCRRPGNVRRRGRLRFRRPVPGLPRAPFRAASGPVGWCPRRCRTSRRGTTGVLPSRWPGRSARSDRDRVGVVVLHALVGGVDVVAQGAADTRDLVGRHHGTDPGAADQHGPLGLTGADQVGGGPGDVREVDRGLAGRARSR